MRDDLEMNVTKEELRATKDQPGGSMRGPISTIVRSRSPSYRCTSGRSRSSVTIIDLVSTTYSSGDSSDPSVADQMGP